MNHDVFISYSSRNKPTALAICHVLEEHRIKCWIAPRDIPPGADYGDVIDDAIVACRLFLLVFSEPASLSQWVKGELNLAFSEKKIIIPYRIDDTPLKGAMRLILNQMHWIEAYPDAASKFGDLVDAAERFLGRQPTLTAAPTRAAEPVAAPIVKEKVYRVGDYYHENGKEGIVFEVDAEGRHGKIVGLRQGEELRWCSKEEYAANRDISSGATAAADGMYNQRMIERTAGWREKFPAFAWCASQGEGWYLPAIDELGLLLLDTVVHEAVNRTLIQRGGKPLVGVKASGDYWSSTENTAPPMFRSQKSQWFARRVSMHYMSSQGMSEKSCTCFVRAVTAF